VEEFACSAIERNIKRDPSPQPCRDFTSIDTLVSQFQDHQVPYELPLRVFVQHEHLEGNRQEVETILTLSFQLFMCLFTFLVSS